MTEDKEWVAGMAIAMVILFILGFFAGYVIDECTKKDDLAKVIYKNTDEYLQHRHDNFYELLKLVETKEVR